MLEMVQTGRARFTETGGCNGPPKKSGNPSLMPLRNSTNGESAIRDRPGKCPAFHLA